MPIKRTEFGRTPAGEVVEQFTLTNKAGAVMKLITFGARVTELHVPDRHGKLANVTLGYEHLDGYLADQPYFGCVVGRVCNRINKGTFTLEGKQHQITINNGPNALHGGAVGIDQAIWKAHPVERSDGPGVDFSHVSPDGDQGFPGKLTILAKYTLTETSGMRVEFEAATDKPTPVNLCNHAYFNLAGAGNGLIHDHVVTMHAQHYTPVNQDLIPTGELFSVANTLMDFTSPHPIGQRIHQIPGGGYDHNYVLAGYTGKLISAVHVHEPKSGRTMEVLTTQPGVQFYTANFLDGSLIGHGGAYHRHGAFCLEAQHFPDSVNHHHFPSTIIRPGQAYRETVIYKFGVK